MKTRTLILFLLMTTVTHAQNFISNKGNLNQTYPKVTVANPVIQALVNQVSIPNLEASIRWMQNLGCRDAQSAEALQTQNWLVNQFESLGLDVYVHYFPLISLGFGYCAPPIPGIGLGNQLEAGNVIATQYGTEFPDEYIIISSHYDHPDGPRRRQCLGNSRRSGNCPYFEPASV